MTISEIDLNKLFGIKGVSCDSRKVKPGYAFVAISGFKNDGNQYIEEAIKNGAKIVFTDKILKDTKRFNTPVIHVNDSRSFISKLASYYYHNPSNKLKIIGITGTNGKTTTSHMIYNLLNSNNNKAGLIGTVKVDTGLKIKNGNLTTPPPVLLQKYFSEMLENKLNYCSMEVSSHGIELKRIKTTKFAVKIGTNISEDHYDLHQSFEDYINVKSSYLSNNDLNTLVIVNNDDQYLSFIKKNKLQLNYGIDKNTDIMAKNIKYNIKETEFIYSLNKYPGNFKKEKFKIVTPLKGKHNIYNSLAAITTGLHFGLDRNIIQDFFSSYHGVWRRLEIIYNKEFTIIDDCAHNPGSYEAVFKSIINLPYKKIHILNSLRGNRGIRINLINAEILSKFLNEKNIEYNLITSNCIDLVSEDDIVSKAEEKAFINTLKNNEIKFRHYNSLNTGLKTVVNEVKEDELILLLGPHAMDHAAEMILELL